MDEGDGEAVKVAVKVRPFNQRELDNKCKLIVEMNGPTTTLHHESGDENLKKTFTFDYSYWSFKPTYDSEPVDAHYTNNTQVFHDIGRGVLANAWAGYNTSLFAYGQTGSGKSHSMLGVPDDPGIIPLVSEDIFRQISSKNDEGTDDFESPPEYIVEASMFEIYNEKIQDLLSGKKDELDIREDPKTGPYVQGLSKHVCRSYAEIKKLNEEGDKARTTGATKMNAKSSRAHTIFQIRFEQKTHRKGAKPTIKVSTISLVDLAGAEKQKSTEATGDRAKEGIKINLSLTNLGICISALAENCSNRKKKVVVPFRSSKLTFILKNMLGGNSKTIMIAAISPASINYNETLSTLEYASRAKKIKTVAKVNEDENEKLIRQLKGQVAELEKQLQLARQGIDPTKTLMDPETEKELQELRAQLTQSQSVIQELQMSTEDREKRTKEIQEVRLDSLKKAGLVLDDDFDRKKDCHLVNLNEDAFMSEQLLYPIKIGLTSIGSQSGNEILLEGLGIEESHCTIKATRDGEKITLSLTPGSGETFVNGDKVTGTVVLEHGCRIIFGSSFVFKLVKPMEAASGKRVGSEVIDWMFAQKELMKAQFKVESGPSEQEVELQNKLIEMEKQQKEREEQLKKEKQHMEEVAEQAKKKLEEEQKKLKEMLENAKQNDKASEEIKRMQELQQLSQQQLEQQRREFEEKQKKMLQQLEEEKKKIQAQVEQQKEKDRLRSMLEENLARLIPIVNEANSISKKLSRNKKFELKIIYEQGLNDETRSSVGVVVSDPTGPFTTWNADEMISRRFVMQEVYQEYMNCVESGSQFSINTLLENGVIEYDPFEDPEAFEKYNLIGTSRIFLKTLAHNIEFGSYTPILDFQGQKGGEIKVGITPLDENGRSEKEGADIEIYSDPSERIGGPVNFTLHIMDAKGLPANICRDLSLRYRFYLEGEDTQVSVQGNSESPVFNFSKTYNFRIATTEFINYLSNRMLVIYVYGKRVLNAEQQQLLLEIEEKKKVNVDALYDKIRMLEQEREQVLSDLELMSQEKKYLEESQGHMQETILKLKEEINGAKSKPDVLNQQLKQSSSENESRLCQMEKDMEEKNKVLQSLEQQLKEERLVRQKEKEALQKNQEALQLKHQEEVAKNQVMSTEFNRIGKELAELKQGMKENSRSPAPAVDQEHKNDLEEELKKKEEEIRFLKYQLEQYDQKVKQQQEELIKRELVQKAATTILQSTNKPPDTTDQSASKTCTLQ